MPSIIKNAIRRVKSEGIISPSRFAFYRLQNVCLLHRYRIVPALKEAGGVICKDELGIVDPDSNQYAPTPMQQFGAFRTLMRRFVRPTSQDVFLDFGSGLGGAILMAATFQLRKIIGVEFSHELNARAAEIVRRHKNRLATKEIQFVTADATKYEVPSDVTIIYMYNPFILNTLRIVLLNIKKSLEQNPRHLRFIACNPYMVKQMMPEFPWLQMRAEIRYPDCYAGDAIFDVYDAFG